MSTAADTERARLANEYDLARQDLRLAVRKMLALAYMASCEGVGFYAKLCLEQSWHAEDRQRAYLFDNLEDAAEALPVGDNGQTMVKNGMQLAAIAFRSRVRPTDEVRLRREGAQYRHAYVAVMSVVEELERVCTGRTESVLYYHAPVATLGPDRHGPLRRAVVTRRLKTRLELSSPKDGELRIAYSKRDKRWVDYHVFTAEEVLTWTR